MNTINMLSSAEKVKGQGVMSAYLEQVSLVREGLHDDYDIFVNKVGFCDIMHYHTIDFQHFLFLPLAKLKATDVVGDFIYACKLINDAGVVVVRKTIVVG